MNFVALKMLFGDRAKYLMLLAGLTFSTMLIVQQGSIFWGLMMWSQSGISNINVPVWVTDPEINQVEEVKPLADTAVTVVRSVPGVEWAVPLYKGLQRARLADGNYEQISLVGLDTATLIGRPNKIFEGRIEDLRAPDTVVIDQWAVERLGGPDKIKVGTVFEINDRLARVVGIARTQKSFQNVPYVYTTYDRALAYTPPERRKLSYVLAKPTEGVTPEAWPDGFTLKRGWGLLRQMSSAGRPSAGFWRIRGSASISARPSCWVLLSGWPSQDRLFTSSRLKT